MNYRKRIIDKTIEDTLKYMGAIYIKGCKWCGKSTTAQQFANSFIDFSNPDEEANYQAILKEKPSLLLEGEKPRLLDEWQLGKVIWNSVKYDVDKSGLKGQYILTGSSTPIENNNDDLKLHPGTGRFAFLNMKPMTLYESNDSNGKISLKDIIDGKTQIDGIKSNITYEKLAYLVCRGGWPEAIDLEENQALNISKYYIDAVVNSDASRVDGVNRNPNLLREILKSYARNICTIDSDESLYNDVLTNYSDVSKNTIIDYINAIKKLLIFEEIPAWNPNIRSKTIIRTSPKKTWVDPSLACAALNVAPKDLMLDPNTFGLMFENMVIRDLSVYASQARGYLNFYRDRYGIECDTVLHFDNGKYGLIEIKLSNNGISDGEKNLLKILQLIKDYNLKEENANKKLNEPDFFMIIVGTGNLAYKTKDNILIVPIGCLKD